MARFKKLFLVLVMFLIALPSVFAEHIGITDITDNLLGYYPENNVNQIGILPDLDVNGNPTTETCKVGNCYDFDGGGDFLNLTGLSIGSSADSFTICYWINSSTATTGPKSTVHKWATGGSEVATFDWSDGTDKRIYVVAGATNVYNSFLGVTNAWELWCQSFNSPAQRHQIWRNTTQVKDGVTSSATCSECDNNRHFVIGYDHLNANGDFNGKIDEILILNRSWSDDLQSYLYNDGEGRTLITNFTLVARDSLTGDIILNYNASVNDTIYNTSWGSVITNIGPNSAVYIDISINATGFSYYNISNVPTENRSFTAFLLPLRSINLTFRDEETTALVADPYNVTIEVIGATTRYNGSTSTGYINFSLLIPDNYTMRYSALPEYATKTYNVEIRNDTQASITLYLINDSLQSDVVATVLDQNLRRLEGVNIQIFRYFSDSNSYKKVGDFNTNFDGQAVLPVVLNSEWYRFRLIYQGVEKLFTEGTTVFSTDLTFQINTEGTFQANYQTYRGVSHSLNFSNSTQLVKFTWLDDTNKVSQACVKAWRVSGNTKELVNQSCDNNPSGTIFIGGFLSNESFYEAKSYISLPSEPNIFLSSISFGDSSRVWGLQGLAYYILVQTLFVFVLPVSLTIGLAAFPIPLILAKAVGIVYFDWSVVAGITFVCFLLAVIVSILKRRG